MKRSRAHAQQSPSSLMINHEINVTMEREKEPMEVLNDKGRKRKFQEIDDEDIIVIDDMDTEEEMQFQQKNTKFPYRRYFEISETKKRRRRNLAAEAQILPSSLMKQTAHTNSVLDNTDPKRGKQIKFLSSKTASRNRRTKVEKAFCSICMEATPLTEIFTIMPCYHFFCNSCTIQYASSKIEQNVSRVSCPEPDCKIGFLDPVLCKEILPKEVFEKMDLLLCESSIGVNSRFYCPFKDCSALLLRDEGIEITNSECPHCHRMFCAKCKVSWYAEISCEEFQKLNNIERGREDLMLKKLAKNNKWQRCPQCKMYVEKIDGCKFIKCRCGYCFCYVCGTPMSSLTHYCIKYMS